MIEDRVKWKCRGCDGECVVNCYPNPGETLRGCVYGGTRVVEWERIEHD